MKVLQILSANGAIYMLVEAGGGNELQAYTSSGTNWTTVTDATFKVLQVAAADDAVFMVAGKDGGTNLVWRYDGVGSSWSQIFGPGANVGSMAILDGVNLCVLASTSDGPNQVFQFNGTPYDWTALTDMNWIVVSIDNNNNRLHMKASNDLGRSYPEWTYSGTPNQWLAGAQ